MKSILVEEGENGKKAYESVIVDPKGLSTLNNSLSLRIVQELAKAPACALDIARSLEIHEQKIYYHIRKLESAGIIKNIRQERRLGMTAKIYGVLSPVVATKLYDDGLSLNAPIKMMENMQAFKLLYPFIDEGKLNAIVIVGDTYSHGKYDMYAREAAHLFDLGALFGNFVSEMNFPLYKLDTEVKKKDLENNLIVVGHPQTNVVLEKLLGKLPIEFDKRDNWSFTSKSTKTKYREPMNGVIVKMDNPFCKGKKILVICGRTRGIKSAILSLTKFLPEISKDLVDDNNFFRIIVGSDKTGDRIIDTIKVLE